jgi:hypothetical protein
VQVVLLRNFSATSGISQLKFLEQDQGEGIFQAFTMKGVAASVVVIVSIFIVFYYQDADKPIVLVLGGTSSQGKGFLDLLQTTNAFRLRTITRNASR